MPHMVDNIQPELSLLKFVTTIMIQYYVLAVNWHLMNISSFSPGFLGGSSTF